MKNVMLAGLIVVALSAGSVFAAEMSYEEAIEKVKTVDGYNTEIADTIWKKRDSFEQVISDLEPIKTNNLTTAVKYTMAIADRVRAGERDVSESLTEIREVLKPFDKPSTEMSVLLQAVTGKSATTEQKETVLAEAIDKERLDAKWGTQVATHVKDKELAAQALVSICMDNADRAELLKPAVKRLKRLETYGKMPGNDEVISEDLFQSIVEGIVDNSTSRLQELEEGTKEEEKLAKAIASIKSFLDE